MNADDVEKIVLFLDLRYQLPRNSIKVIGLFASQREKLIELNDHLELYI